MSTIEGIGLSIASILPVEADDEYILAKLRASLTHPLRLILLNLASMDLEEHLALISLYSRTQELSVENHICFGKSIQDSAEPKCKLGVDMLSHFVPLEADDEDILVKLRASLTHPLRSVLRSLASMDLEDHLALISLYSRAQQSPIENRIDLDKEIRDSAQPTSQINTLGYDLLSHIASYLGSIRCLWTSGLSCTCMNKCFIGSFHSLRLGGSKSEHVLPILRRIDCAKLCEVVVCGAFVEDQWICAVIQNCLQLRCITFGCPNSITDAGLKAVAEYCPCLTHLSICECKGVTDNGFMALVEHCDRLISLSIVECSLTAIVDIVVKYNPEIVFEYTIEGDDDSEEGEEFGWLSQSVSRMMQ